VLDRFRARDPFELSRLDDAPGRVSSAMGLPANGAVTVTHELERASDFVRNSSTKAASLYRHVQTPERISVKPNASGKPRRASAANAPSAGARC
jgi:hypothetical protein